MVHRHLLKIISLFMAIGLWFYVLNSESDIFEKKVTLRYLLPEGKSFVRGPPYQVKIKLRGPKAFLRVLMEREQSILVDLKQSKPVRRNPEIHHFKLKESLLSLPLGVSIEQYEWTTLSLELDKSIFKEVPIKLNLVGKVQENRKLVEGELFPGKLKLEGARLALGPLGKVQSQPVDLTQLDGEGELPLSFVGLPRHIQISGEEKEAVFRYRIVAQKINFTLDRIPIRFLSSRRVVRSSHRMGTIFVFLDNEKSVLGRDQVQLVADIPDTAKGSITIDLKAEIPKEAHLIRIVPPQIIVVVK